MSVYVNRTEPFKYYSIEVSTPNKNDLISNFIHKNKVFFNTLFCVICNVGIAVANSLQLYKLCKVKLEEKAPEIEEKPPSVELKLTWQQKYSFIASTFSLLDTYTSSNATLSLPFVRSYFNLRHLQDCLDNPWKKRIALIGCIFKEFVIFKCCGSIYQSWETYHIAKRSFNNLKQCVNDTNKPLKSKLLNIMVHSGNLVHTISCLYLQIHKDYYAHLFSKFLNKNLETITIDNVGSSLRNFLEDTVNFEGLFLGESLYYNGNEVMKCRKILPFVHKILPIKNRILSLSPKCSRHAFEIIAPGESYWNRSAIKKAYRGLQFMFHPDKCKKKYCESVSFIISEAMKTISKVWEGNARYNFSKYI